MKENDTVFELAAYDNAVRAQGFFTLAGVDEAGRGPLAGPVVAAAVIWEAGRPVPAGLDDSKKIKSEAVRERLAEEIRRHAVDYAVATASVAEIARLNILGATFLAMERAVAALRLRPDMILVDGNRLPPGIGHSAQAVVGGDGRSASIAAASVLAKTTRDAMMRELDCQYPGYGFARHKGYGTKAHSEALRRMGPCPAHRALFIRGIIDGAKKDCNR